MGTHNSVCPLCGSQAYQGFADIECSSSGCKNYKAQAQENPDPRIGIIPLLQIVGSGVNAVPATGVKTMISPAPRVNPNRPQYLKRLTHRPMYNAEEQEAFLVLDEIRKTDPGAKIMGGAARDFYLMRWQHLKDIDINCQILPPAPPGILPIIQLGTLGSLQRVATQSSYPTMEVYDFSSPTLKNKYQFIKINESPDDYLATFDFGINMIQCWSDKPGEVTFSISAMFDIDLTNHHLTFYPEHTNHSGYRNLYERWQKMSAKFPAYTLSIGRI